MRMPSFERVKKVFLPRCAVFQTLKKFEKPV